MLAPIGFCALFGIDGKYLFAICLERIGYCFRVEAFACLVAFRAIERADDDGVGFIKTLGEFVLEYIPCCAVRARFEAGDDTLVGEFLPERFQRFMNCSRVVCEIVDYRRSMPSANSFKASLW